MILYDSRLKTRHQYCNCRSKGGVPLANVWTNRKHSPGSVVAMFDKASGEEKWWALKDGEVVQVEKPAWVR